MRITREQLVEAASRYRSSDTVNPRMEEVGEDRCVYTSKDGTRHCIAGQLAIDLGGQAPRYEDVYGLHEQTHRRFEQDTGLTFTEPAFILLTKLQNAADFSVSHPVPYSAPWSRVIEQVLGGNDE